MTNGREENRELFEDNQSNISEKVTHEEGNESSYKYKDDDSQSLTSEEQQSKVSESNIINRSVARLLLLVCIFTRGSSHPFLRCTNLQWVCRKGSRSRLQRRAMTMVPEVVEEMLTTTTTIICWHWETWCRKQTTNNNSNNFNATGAGFSLAFGLPSLGTNNTNNMQQLPMLGMMGFPGTSPNSWMGNANEFYGYAPSTSIYNYHHHRRNDSTPEVPPLNDIKIENGHGGNDSGDGQHQQHQQRISGIGMTPLVFQQHRVPTHQQLLQVVSTDSQTDDYLKKASSSNPPPHHHHAPPLPSSSATTQQHANAMIPRMGKIPAAQQQSKKWVR